MKMKESTKMLLRGNKVQLLAKTTQNKTTSVNIRNILSEIPFTARMNWNVENALRYHMALLLII
jgi:hypothetical protein